MNKRIQLKILIKWSKSLKSSKIQRLRIKKNIYKEPRKLLITFTRLVLYLESH